MAPAFSLRGLLRDAEAERVEQDIRAELESHLELCADELAAGGRTNEEARREARVRFGDLDKTLRACRRARIGGRLAMQRLQWILIAILGASTLLLGLRGRSMYAMATQERERAMQEAQIAQQALAQLRQQEVAALEPVEVIQVGVGDKLQVVNDMQFELRQNTQVQADGQALFKQLGWVPVAGRTRQEIEQTLTERYAEFFEGVGPVYVIVESLRY